MAGRNDPMALAVVIPAGPADDIEDTLDSVLHFIEPPRSVIIVDDTRRSSTAQLVEISSDIHVVPALSAKSGRRGVLWRNVAAGFSWAAENLHFEMLLRLDADALIIGPGLERLAAARFAQDRTIGLLGSNRLGMDGGTRDWSWPAAALDRECGLAGMRHPGTRRCLRFLRREARANGYVPGEHPLGAACIFSADAIATMHQRGWLSLATLRRSRLGDDHLFGLMVVAAGYAIGEFAGPDDPLALDWKGLPAAPAELLARRKVATHSVRSWDGLDEHEIRTYFAEDRAARGTSPEGPNPRR